METEIIELQDMPDSILGNILINLTGDELARFSTLSRRLHQRAQDNSLWETVCKARWPLSPCNLHQCYNQDWKEVFRCRAAMPVVFPTLLDRIHQCCVRKEETMRASTFEQDDVFDKMMHAIFSVGLCCCTAENRSLTATVEYEALCRELECWVSQTQPQVSECLRRFVSRTRAFLDEYDFWVGGFVHWPDVPWRRSALEFFLDMVFVKSARQMHHEPMLALVKDLDEAIKSASEEAESLSMAAPAGTPRSHW
eukprot:CAMPEP_0114263786 /NCGR_PEP_ID=MMETSP0058-20121206/22761_1 /TAXON_ID=36894 /ORGANISM="Pyramimonas parkeae, CCMP726" /LENGTH=252 /DNA_ID=CAMNT_0001380221 /DNA_START=275 /DNA_END=1030 /DNA_ORIENTATION=-